MSQYVQTITRSCSIESPQKSAAIPAKQHHMCISASSLEATECPKAFERQEAPVLREATHNMPSLWLPLTLPRSVITCIASHNDDGVLSLLCVKPTLYSFAKFLQSTLTNRCCFGEMTLWMLFSTQYIYDPLNVAQFTCLFRKGVITVGRWGAVSDKLVSADTGHAPPTHIIISLHVRTILTIIGTICRDHICHKQYKQRLCKIIITRVKVHFVDVF